eukprot:793206-Prymnesium_polylepis.1
MAREAKEETGGALSDITIARIRGGKGVRGTEDANKVVYEGANAVAVVHDLVVPCDKDVHERFDPKKAASMRTERMVQPSKKRKRKAPTEQLGIEFVSVENLKDFQWRNKNMHHCPSVLVARLARHAL